LQYISNNINADTSGFVFYCFVYDGTLGTVTDRITLYRNGVLDVGPTVSQTGTFTAINTNTTPGIQVGGRSASIQPLNGNVHSVALFNTNLSGAQITSLYNGGTAFDFRQSTVSANLVSYAVAGNGTAFGAQWTWNDLIISGATFTSQNMELADLVNDAP
jgi:hypothetical protein